MSDMYRTVQYMITATLFVGDDGDFRVKTFEDDLVLTLEHEFLYVNETHEVTRLGAAFDGLLQTLKQIAEMEDDPSAHVRAGNFLRCRTLANKALSDYSAFDSNAVLR